MITVIIVLVGLADGKLIIIIVNIKKTEIITKKQPQEKD